MDNLYMIRGFALPAVNMVDYDDYDYCPECGQHIDKSMEQEGER